MAAKAFFAPVPVRAFSDKSLTAIEHRVLQVIAWHDGLGRNGVGCTAGLEAIAAEAACERSRTAATITSLVVKGYIERLRHATNGRRREYRVVYGAEIGCETATEDRLRDSNLSGSVARSVAIKVARENANHLENTDEFEPNRDNIITEIREDARLRRPRIDQLSVDDRDLMKLLAPLDRALASEPQKIEDNVLGAWRDWLEENQDEIDDFEPQNPKLVARLRRVAEAVDYELAVRAAGL